MEWPTIFPPSRPEGVGRVAVVAVLNSTPDSFSDGGRFVRGSQVELGAAVDIAAQLVAEGADALDVGGESTRPGARPVPETEEIERTAPLIEALAKRFEVPLSIDTRKTGVAEAALEAGARVVNDVSGLRHDARLAEGVARRGAALVLGHLRGTPETMQEAVAFDDAVGEVAAELAESLGWARAAGVEALAVDPGLGFGKHLEHNLALLAGVGELRRRLGVPVWVGPSRKAFLGQITGDPVGERDDATAAACALAAFLGADAVRVHSVPAVRRAVLVGEALRTGRALREGRP